jgi:hypothetical protein
MITGSSSDYILAMKGELSHAFQMTILLASMDTSVLSINQTTLRILVGMVGNTYKQAPVV